MSLVTLWNQNQNKVYSSQYELKCPPSNEKTRKVLEYYVLHPHWSDKRVEIGTSSLVASDIEVLTSIVDGQVCTYLNSLYSSTINEKWPDNSPAYHVSFFKAGDFYFVSIAVAQPADPEWMSVGLSMIDVFDTSLNKLAGYSF
jgi:hypothetical protein